MKKFLITLIPVLFFFTSLNKIQAQHQQLQTVFINIPHLKKLSEVKKINGRNIVVQSYEAMEKLKLKVASELQGCNRSLRYKALD